MLLPLQGWCWLSHSIWPRTKQEDLVLTMNHEFLHWMWVCHGKFSYANTFLNIQWAKLIKLKSVLNVTCFWWSLLVLLITTSLRCTFWADKMSSFSLDLPLWLMVPRNTPSNNVARSQATVCPACSVFTVPLKFLFREA